MKMKAAFYHEYGSADVIQFGEMPKPVPTSKQVLINIKATTVNRTDTETSPAKYFVTRLYSGLLKPKHPILGTDFSGVVVEVGSEVTKFKVGDKVIGFNDQGIQSQAEYLALDEKYALPMAKNQSFEEAAASLEGPHYALTFMRKAKPEPGKKVLVYGATGGIGSATVQILKYYGAHVTAVCDTENIDKIKALGPDRVIDYKKQNYWEEDIEYDFVCDAVGKSSFSNAKKVLVKKGIYVSSELGKNGENIYLALLTPLGRGKKVIFPIPKDTSSSIKIMTKMIEEGKYKPLIDRVYPFEEIVDAYRYVSKGFKTGNVVVRISD